MTRAVLFVLLLAGCEGAASVPCSPSNVVGTWAQLDTAPPIQSHALTLRADGVADDRIVTREDNGDTAQAATISSWSVFEGTLTVHADRNAPAVGCTVAAVEPDEMRLGGERGTTYVRTSR